MSIFRCDDSVAPACFKSLHPQLRRCSFERREKSFFEFFACLVHLSFVWSATFGEKVNKDSTTTWRNVAPACLRICTTVDWNRNDGRSYTGSQKYTNTCRYLLWMYYVCYTKRFEILLSLLRDSTVMIILVKFEIKFKIFLIRKNCL